MMRSSRISADTHFDIARHPRCQRLKVGSRRWEEKYPGRRSGVRALDLVEWVVEYERALHRSGLAVTVADVR